MEALYLKNLLAFLDHHVSVTVATESAAAKGIGSRLGVIKRTKYFAAHP